MAKQNKQKLQKLSNIDFSAEGCHVALVPKGANGEDFLVVKSLTADQCQEGVELLKELEQHSSATNDPVEKSTQKLTENGVAEMPNPNDDKALDNADVEQVLKAQEELKAQLDEVLKANAEQGKVMEEQAKQLETMQGIEDARVEKKYQEVAAKYAPLGVVAEDSEVLKSLASIDKENVILKALDKALNVLDAEKDPETFEKGVGGEGNTDAPAIAQLQEIAKGLMDKDGSLSLQQAITEAALANPELVG